MQNTIAGTSFLAAGLALLEAVVTVSALALLRKDNGPVSTLESAVAGSAAIAPLAPITPLTVQGAELEVTGLPLSVAALAWRTSSSWSDRLFTCAILCPLSTGSSATVPRRPVSPLAIHWAVHGSTHVFLCLLELVRTAEDTLTLRMNDDASRPGVAASTTSG